MPNCPSCGGAGEVAYRLADRAVVVCQRPDCTLRFAEPQPSDEALKRLYTDYYYGTESPILEASPEAYLRQVVEALPSQIGPIRGKRVLDFGCGTGTLFRLLVEAGAEVDGVESDRHARERVSREQGVEIAADLDEVGRRVESGAYDLIAMIEVVEHLRVPDVTLRALHGLLQPAGVLLLSTPDAASLRARLAGRRWESYQNPTHLFYFNRRALARVLRAAGFAEIRLWQPRFVYPNHGPVRRILQRVLQQFGLAGALRVLARGSLPLAVAGRDAVAGGS